MSSNASTLAVKCGDMEAILDISRFGPGGRSRCILYGGQWITLTHFEEISGKGNSHNWKRSVRYQNKPLIYWIEEGKLKICNKACFCRLCQGGTPPPNYLMDQEPSEEPRVPKLAAIVKAKQQEYDSDSGISVSSCTKALKIETNFFEDEITDDQSTTTSNSERSNKTELDYTTMAQEALLALAKSTGENGCSQMNVLLYILNKYKPTEDIAIVNNKVKTSLKFLTRMGVTNKLSIDGNETDSDEEDISETSSDKSDPKPPTTLDVKPKKKSLDTQKQKQKQNLKSTNQKSSSPRPKKNEKA